MHVSRGLNLHLQIIFRPYGQIWRDQMACISALPNMHDLSYNSVEFVIMSCNPIIRLTNIFVPNYKFIIDIQFACVPLGLPSFCTKHSLALSDYAWVLPEFPAASAYILKPLESFMADIKW